MPAQRRFVVVSLIVAVVSLLGLSGCAAPSESADPGTQVSQGGEDTDFGDEDAAPDDEGTDEEGTADGEADPAQDLVRTGPVAQYGGPAYGDQGVEAGDEEGRWCDTIAVFWGGDAPVPDGVTFTFEQAVADHPGLEIEPGTCGTKGADRTCIGLEVGSADAGIFCSIVLRPSDAFVEGTQVTFEGTVRCPSSEICDQVAARAVQPGPPIVVSTPAEG